MNKEKKICKKCNSENSPESKICKKCGFIIMDETCDLDVVNDHKDMTDETCVVEFKYDKDNIVADRYQILSEVGRGAMGVVYKAWDQKLERYIALKTIKFDQKVPVKIEEFRKRLISEAKAIAKLKHPHIVTVHDVGIEELSSYVAMELIDGYPLTDIIKNYKNQDLDKIVDIISQVLEAISHAHSNGIIHRDLKPANIMLENENYVKIADFGIAKIVEDQEITLGDEGRIMGTPSYMAPERFEGIQDDLRSDIYSIGIIMYELITGTKPPRKATSPDKLPSYTLQPDLNFSDEQSIPDFLREIFVKVIEKDRKKRFQNAEEFKKELIQKYKAYKGKSIDVVEQELLFNVPLHRNINFTGRERELKKISEELSSNKILAIHGLGGMGKTQVTLEYLYRHHSDYRIIWWIHSDDPSVISSDYASLAEPLGLPSLAMKEQEVVAIVKGKLEQQDRWLLIFDNAENPEDILGYFPKTKKGHILISSRNPNWGGVTNTLSLDVMTSEEAVNFLLKRTKDKEKKTARKLADSLGRLPLALEQAGSYIETTGRSISEYFNMFKQYKEKLLSRGKPPDYPETVSTTWEISFQRIREKFDEAVDLMNLVAFFGPDDIPVNILVDGAECLPKNLSRLVIDPFDFDDAITVLRNYSIIKRHGQYLYVHRLVQNIVRDRLDEKNRAHWAEAAIRICNKAFVFDRDDMRTWEECSRIFPHALTSAEHAEDYKVVLVDVCEILNNTGEYLSNLGQLLGAKEITERALAIAEKIYGYEHQSIVVSLNNLSKILKNLGEFERSKDLIERALEIDEKNLGSDHPNVAKHLCNLGVILRELGQLEKARKLMERALAIYENVYGSEHPNIAKFLNNLGLIIRDLGEPMKAKRLLELALAIVEKEFGSEHPNTAIRFNNLGLILKDLGELDNAKKLFERTLVIDEKLFGREHPTTAISLSNLGDIIKDLGELPKAKELVEEALRINEKAFGPDHPNVAGNLCNLAMIHKDLGNITEAKKMINQALSIDEKAFNPEHYRLARDQHKLGLVLEKAGEFEKARMHLQKSLSIHLKALGEHHPKTQKVKEDMASLPEQDKSK